VTDNSFTDLRKERFLALIEAGRTTREACDSVGVSHNTIYRHVDSDPVFGSRYRMLKEGPQHEGLIERDLIRLLEAKARQGSVQAIKMLLETPWRKTKEQPVSDAEEEKATGLFDELAARRTKS
jgi:transposase